MCQSHSLPIYHAMTHAMTSVVFDVIVLCLRQPSGRLNLSLILISNLPRSCFLILKKTYNILHTSSFLSSHV